MLKRARLTPVFRMWWRMSRGMTLGVRGLARDASGAVLLVRHTYAPGWHFPGGGVEHGETAMQAVLREMAEEGGIAAQSPPRLLGVFSNHRIFRNDHVLLFAFDAWTRCDTDSEGEIAERAFFPPDRLPADTAGPAKRRLAELAAGAAPDPYW